MQELAIPILILVVAAALAFAVRRHSPSTAWLSAMLALGWFGIVMLEGGTMLAACIGLAALLPFLARNFGGQATLLRLAMFAVALVLFAFTHVDRLVSLPDIALMAAVGLGMFAFVLRSPETDRVPGIEAAHLCVVALGIAAIAIDMQRGGPALSLPAILAGAMAGCLLASRPPGSTALGAPTADAAALLVAFLLGDLALAGAWAPALVLGAFAALEITVLLVTAARADRSNDKDRARGVYVEAMARQRGQRQAFTGTIFAGILVVILALGASQDEWIAALLGAGALMWLFQRYLWRLVPERRPD
jgi:predicted secreted protein